MITLENVSKTFDHFEGGLTVLHNVNLNIDPAEFVAIVGKSGSGKSSLLNILGLLDRDNSGTVLFFGRETSMLSEDECSQLRGACVGFVFQSFQLIPHLSVLENVKLPLFYQKVPPQERNDFAKRCLERVHMEHRLKHLPNQLSGGECQRVAIARALVADPAMILADEPTGNLDSKTEASIFSLFKELNEQGRTIVLITHEMSLADEVPRKIIIADGRVVEDSTS